MRGSIRIGKIFGIPIGLHYSWFVIFGIVTFSLSYYIYPDSYPGWSNSMYWLIGIITSLLFFCSVLAHELSHSLVSRRNGVPIKSITLFIFGGVARISRESSRASGEFKMAIAGPLSSMVIAGIFTVIWLISRNSNEPVAALSSWLAYINGSLAVFNMIPGFPLDGGRVLRSILWGATRNYRRATRIATRIGQGVAYLMIIGGLVIAFKYDWLSGIWLAFIGWFLNNAATASFSQVTLREGLGNFTAGDVMLSLIHI